VAREWERVIVELGSDMMDGWVDGWMDGWMDGCMHREIDGEI
jgi:hypothetical protein